MLMRLRNELLFRFLLDGAQRIELAVQNQCTAAIRARKLVEVGLSIALGVDGTAHNLHATRSEQRLEPILRTHYVGHEFGIHIGMRSELA